MPRAKADLRDRREDRRARIRALPYGRFIAKLEYDFLRFPLIGRTASSFPVTAISPTPAGEGKTTTTIGLGDALRPHWQEGDHLPPLSPLLGPCFGLKGGATGGGYLGHADGRDQPSLHRGFHAITSAHNLLAAMLDTMIEHWGNALALDQRRIVRRRAVDMNDRALRETVIGLGGGNGFTREDGFDITVASEVMATFRLASSLEDLEEQLGRMVVAASRTGGRSPRPTLTPRGR